MSWDESHPTSVPPGGGCQAPYCPHLWGIAVQAEAYWEEEVVQNPVAYLLGLGPDLTPGVNGSKLSPIYK